MKRFHIFSLLILNTLFAFAQQPAELQQIMSYMRHAMNFSKAMPQEKVYLHIDNTGYFMGETIWFKAYVVRADFNFLTNLSKVVYVELVNPSGDVVETRKLKVTNGCAYGDIKVDSIFGAGFYELRAYTRYMTNWGNGGIFSRTIPIFKRPKNPGDYSQMVMDEITYKKRLPNLRDTSDDTSDADGRLRIRFYPEGGHLVKGVPCRVAFYATDRTGNVVEAGGALLNDKKEVMDAVATQREGRGLFRYIPDETAHYLRMADSKGKQHDFRLPDAEDEGMSLDLNTLEDNKITATLYCSKSLHGKLLGYTIMHNGVTLRADTVVAEYIVMMEFDRAKMRPGVNQITFFTSDGQILAERLFFIRPESKETDSIRITTPVAFPKPCGKITLNIQAQPQSLLSLSAIDAATMVNGAEGNAQTYLLLSSELKGYISDPGYYFESDDKKHRADADLLMMVQGWRRYDWAFMAGLKNPDETVAKTSFLPPNSYGFTQPIEDQLYIYGQLRQKKKKYSVDNVWLDVNLFNKSGYHFKGEAKTDSNGFYAFKMPDVEGEYTLLINTGKADKNGYWEDANFYVGIDRHFSPTRRLLSAQETTPLPLLKPNLFNDPATRKAAAESNEYIPINKKEHVLPTVVVKAKRKSLFENARAAWASEKEGQHYASIYYNADHDADMYADRGEDLPTVYEWLAKRNPFFGGTNMLGSLEAMEAPVNETLFEDAGGTTDTGFSEDGGEMGSTGDSGNLQTEEMDKNAQESNEQFQTTAKQPRIFRDGLGYKNRPIVWLLDNDYAAISYMTRKIDTSDPSQWMVHRPTNQDLPIFLSEIKGVYISEQPEAYRGALFCPTLNGVAPVTVFLYSHFRFNVASKGVRSTHFQGYNVPSTFEMEDYSVIPPVEDFRRTIFWAPNIITDKEGKAKVEFWNNSSCKEMHISCEGISAKGQILVNE